MNRGRKPGPSVPLVVADWEPLDELPPVFRKPKKERQPNRWEVLREELPQSGWVSLVAEDLTRNLGKYRKTAMRYGVELAVRNGVVYVRRVPAPVVSVAPRSVEVSRRTDLVEAPRPVFPEVGRIGHLSVSERARRQAAEAI